GIQMKEGRSFSRNFGTDSTKIIFNEAAISAMGLDKPLGTKVNLWGTDREISGVVRNFHFASLHENIKPMLIILEPQNTHYVVVKISAGKEKNVLGRIREVLSQYDPGSSFDYKFIDEDYQSLYVAEQRVAVLSRWFAGFAIVISCLGLFGLAAFTMQRRQKEIGIRKVIGASAGNVVVMLSKDFLALVLTAVVIASPLAWWATNAWLNNFAYRVTVGPEVFLFAGVSIVLITLLTISFQSIKAALANPVDSLRSE
ncbi:MAG TPA: FtsX-like permease family protein, partial [Chitinophagaceae bacterium]|nr:FtsX-like permease family protein [Chitinophagaceae bacterium]